MSTAFDPYHKWLGIPLAEQPPHHYRLLGLALFEHDSDVIEIAADQRMALLRSFHTGPHSDLSQKLLNEVAAARLCLLRPDRRQRYDEGLRQRLAAGAPQAAAASKPAPAPTVSSEFDLLDEKPLPVSAAPAKPAPTPAPAAKPAPASAAKGPASGSILAGIGKGSPVKSDSVELLGKAGKRAQTDELELVGKSAKKPQGDTLELVGKTAKKSREIELAPRSSAWDQAIADACSTQSTVHRRRRRWHIDTRVIQFILLIAFVAGLAYAGSIGFQMWQDYDFKRSNTTARTKSNPPPPPTSTSTTTAQTATTPSDSTDQTDVQPAGRQPAFGGGRTFVNNPNELETSPPRPNETNPTPIPARDPSTAQPGSNHYFPSQSARSPVPSPEEQKHALAQINEVYKDDYRVAVGVINQVKLAERFAQVAADTKDPVMRYVLANQALEMANRLGDVELASRIVGGLAANYEINGWELKYKTLTQLARAPRSPKAEVAAAAFSMVDEALTDNRFDSALELATLSMNLASSVKNAALREQARALIEHVKFMQKQTKSIDEASSTLAADPEDRNANLVVGKYKCYIKHDWDAGLPHLAKGADDILRSLAERDQKRPSETEKQVELADAWWSLADQRQDLKNEFESKGLRSRAAYWYRQAMPNLTGFLLEKARHRASD